MKTTAKLQTYRRLGLLNLLRVGLYRLGLRTGLHPVQRVRADIGGIEFFRRPTGGPSELPTPDAWRDTTLSFGWHRVPLDSGPPAWHASVMDGSEAGGSDRPWWTLPDFGLEVGDIKTVWEPSRLDWVLAMAQRTAAGDGAELERLNAWLAGWCAANPAYLGVNWKCGQEASIRVLHLALAARLLGQDAAPSPDLVRLVAAHLERIRPTVSYAKGQDNNHGTSEAAALFIGGSLCTAGGEAAGRSWTRTGRALLENRVRRLIAADGSFSQYSVNYHRLMLDTLSLAELWRRWQDLPAFSTPFRDRARAAAAWLHHLVDPQTGDAPNLGANDGANLLPLTDADFRDHRPAVQLGTVLFAGRLAYGETGSHQDHLAWLGVARPPQEAARPASRHFPDGGYAVLRRAGWTALFRYPRYRFRPHHCDALHLDLWRDGENLLRDGGSYGYNAGSPWRDYFPGTSAHNTVAFDDHEQMPRLGRFLWGRWPRARAVMFAGGDGAAAARYTDWRGCRHERSVRLDPGHVVVEDAVSGFARRAVLRWRLRPGTWTLVGRRLQGEGIAISVAADVEIVRLDVVEGWESRYYLRREPLPVLEIEVRQAGRITTEFVLPT